MFRALRAAAAVLVALVLLAVGAGTAAAQAPTGPAGISPRVIPTDTSVPPSTPAPAAGVEDDELVYGRSNDVLRDNGLSSPWCKPGRRVSPQTQRNCEASGLASSPAAGDNASFDRHVDTGSWLKPKVDRIFASLVLTLMGWGWSLMMTLTRVLFGALEFALSFNPLSTADGSGAAAQLNRQVSGVTRPLMLVLGPVGAIWLAWTIGAKQKFAHAAGQAVLSVLLLMATLVVLANPIGTVGSLVTSAQKAGVAMIGVSSGQPTNGDRAAQRGLQAMAEGLIDKPLGLMQFGDVDFATNPDRQLPKLRAAAMRLALKEGGDKPARVRAARTNLDLFQVWPANSGQRNSINDESSLLRVLCGTDDTHKCEGPSADAAEFRTERGLGARVTGMLVVTLGLLPMWVALGLCAFKILAASLMALIRLVQLTFVAPLALIGEQGNQRVISFGAAFAGNVLSAAAYSAFLGLLMLVFRLVTSWTAYGWVTQWLLLMAALWLVIANRETLWGVANARESSAMAPGGQMAKYMAAQMAVGGIRGTRRQSWRATKKTGGAGWKGTKWAAKKGKRPFERDGRPDTSAGPRSSSGPGGSDPLAGAVPEVAGAVVDRGERSGRARPGASLDAAAAEVRAGERAPTEREVRGAKQQLSAQNRRYATAASAYRRETIANTDVDALQDRKALLDGERAKVAEQLGSGAGNRKALLKRQARLDHRRGEVAGQLAAAHGAQRLERRALQDPAKDRGIRSRNLDHQAKLLRGASGRGERRSYETLAGLTGMSPAQYKGASARERLQVRRDVDRELERRASSRTILGAAKAKAKQPVAVGADEPLQPETKRPKAERSQGFRPSRPDRRASFDRQSRRGE